MSRERLYKAKRVNWRELPKEEWWVEGNLLISDEDYYIIPDFGVSCVEKLNNYVCDNLITLHAFGVDKETVCEYTGLTDKNNRNIFENDIAKMKERNIFGIIKIGKYSDSDYGDSYFGCYIKWSESEKIPWKQNICPWFEDDLINVQGNIFDNPELLEGGEAE